MPCWQARVEIPSGVLKGGGAQALAEFARLKVENVL